MKGIEFQRMAVPVGTAVGSSIAKGLGDAMANYMKARQMQTQRAWQQSRMGEQDALKKLHEIQAEQLGQGVSMTKVMAVHQLNAMAKNGQVSLDPDETGKMAWHVTKQYLDGVKTPAAAQNLQQMVQRLGQQSGDNGLNPREAQVERSMESQDTGVQKANIAAGARKYSADAAASGRVSFDQRVKLLDMKGLQGLDAKLAQDYQNADKAAPMTPPPQAQDVAAKRADISQQRAAIQTKLAALHGGEEEEPETPAAPAAPLPWDKRASAQPGQTVTNPAGVQFVVHSRNKDGTVNFAKPQPPATEAPSSAAPPTAQAPAVGVQAPSSAQAPPGSAMAGQLAPPPATGQ